MSLSARHLHGPQGDLYAISFDVKSGKGGRVLKFAKAAGLGSPLVPLDGLKAPWGIAVDASGRIYVSEPGFSNQVWVYSAAGKPVAGGSARPADVPGAALPTG